MTTETHEEKADRIISMLAWLDGLPPHRRATLKDMIVAGMREAVAYEQERNANNVAAADLQVSEYQKSLAFEMDVSKSRKTIADNLEKQLDETHRLNEELQNKLDAAKAATFALFTESSPNNDTLEWRELLKVLGVGLIERPVHEWVESAESGTVCQKCGLSYFVKDRQCSGEKACVACFAAHNHNLKCDCVCHCAIKR